MALYKHKIIVGPSGAGKGSIIDSIIDYYVKHLKIPIHVVISWITREKRLGDKYYQHISVEEFIKRKENNEFLEWENYTGNFYGTPRAKVDEILELNKYLAPELQTVLLLEVDIKGAMKLKKHFGDSAQTFFIDTPIYLIEKWLRARGTDSEEQIKKRLARTSEEIKLAHKCDFRIKNYEHISAPFAAANEIVALSKIQSHQLA